MQIKEEKLCSLTQKGTRLQLVKVSKNSVYKNEPYNYVLYQVRINRKVVDKSTSEYNERKVFATYAQNIVLQLKIY